MGLSLVHRHRVVHLQNLKLGMTSGEPSLDIGGRNETV